MPLYTGLIQNLVSGDFRQVPWQIPNVPASGAVTKAWITFKEQGDMETTDINAVFQKVITTVLDLDQGHITNTGAVGNVATGFFNLLPEDTILLTPLITYNYDMQFFFDMTDTSTRIETPEIGTVTPLAGVTHAVS